MTTQFQSARPVRGATTSTQYCFRQYLRFQSSRPVRGATSLYGPLTPLDEFQSSRPVRGATLVADGIDAAGKISILAPRAGRDSNLASEAIIGGVFQSSRPVRGATVVPQPHIPLRMISILAPRAGRDV